MKGRPPLAPRIEALEQQLFELKATVAELDKQLFQKRGLIDQIDALKERIDDIKPRYVPRFEHWPGNGG